MEAKPVQSRKESLIEQWGTFEMRADGSADGNPFVDVQVRAEFRQGDHLVEVDGFYDGSGSYVVRFMPDRPGRWTYQWHSREPGLAKIRGIFECRPAGPHNHGPVQVRGDSQFAYADETPYRPYGTTCYAWTHQPVATQEETLRTLASAPFNKIRMCVFPKNYAFNEREPELFPFARSATGGFDLNLFDPAYFQALEQRILQLQALGIECDLILFHPYDKGRWGFDRMDSATDERYLRYVLARLGAYRNVWWSMANEYDFMSEKSMINWDGLAEILARHDPYGHLASIHNGTRMYDPDSLALYDHQKAWVSHVSLQHWDLNLMSKWRSAWGKPVVVDECGYEGNLPQRWGNLTAEDLTDRFWTGFVHGGFVGHGETFLPDDETVWWSHGGRLQGESPARIRFLRMIMDGLPADVGPLGRFRDVATIGVEGSLYLHYLGPHRPAYRDLDLPSDRQFTIDVIDTWNMTVERLPDRYSGPSRVDLPGATQLAILVSGIS